MGNLLMRANVFAHVTHSFPLMDKEYFYRFIVRSIDGLSFTNWILLLCVCQNEKEEEPSFSVMQALKPFVGCLAVSRTSYFVIALSPRNILFQ